MAGDRSMTPMTQWEYRQLMGSTPDFETDLNALGEEGWELSFVSPLPDTSPLQMVAILKRVKAPSNAGRIGFNIPGAVNRDGNDV